MQRTPFTHILTAALCALPLTLCGCSAPSAAGLGSGGPVTPAAEAQASREKMPAEAPANPAAQASGGSGMPSQAGPGGTSSGVAGAALADKPANSSAQSAGGSGMPGPN